MRKTIAILALLMFVWIGSLWADAIRVEIADTRDDGQEEEIGGNMDTRALYMELMWNWFQDRWGGGIRFRDVQIPQGATINSCYISICAYSTGYVCAFDSIAALDADDTDTLGHGDDYYLSERWNDDSLTSARVLWKENMTKSSVYKDSTPDLKIILQEVVDRPGWESGNAVTFIFKNLLGAAAYTGSGCFRAEDPDGGCCHYDPDSACAAYEFRVYESDSSEVLEVNFTAPTGKYLPIKK